MTVTRLLVFLGVVLTLVGGIHFYFWVRLVTNTQMPFPYRVWLAAALVTLPLSMPVAFIAGRAASPARVLGACAGGTAGMLGAYGIAQALSSLHVKEVKVATAKLPAALDGFSIVQLTDVHFGPMIGRGFAEKIVAMANAQTPDVIAITGVDGSVEELRHAAAPLAGLKAKHGGLLCHGQPRVLLGR